MDVFTVTKPGGTKANEFEAYTRLLEVTGVDVGNVPRVPEPETHRRWLYAWTREKEAEEFASVLRHRTRDGSWRVHQVQIEEEARGPVAPLDIYEVRDNEHEFRYYLGPSSRERVNRAYHPHTPMYPVTVSRHDLESMKQQFGEMWWDQLCILVTGLSKEKLLSLGGYRLILPFGEIGHEALPEIPAMA